MNTKVVKKFLLDGELVIFRYPRFSDWSDIMKKGNSLTREKSFGSLQHKQTGKQHRQWMRERLKGIREKDAVYLVAEVRSFVVGNVSIWKIPGEPGRGSLEISIRDTIPGAHEKLRGRGIGKKLIYAIMREAKSVLKTRVVKLGVYVANRRAVELYRRCGFKEMYRVRREKIHYRIMRDRIYMKKHLR